MPEDKTSSRPTREPQALSSEYHKARRQVLLWAGILFIWELVGIDLEKAKEAGNAGAIIAAIKSPQAIPWVLLVLVAYFLFKVTVEWYQCNPSRRKLLVSKFDYFSALVICFAAYGLYAYQAIANVQLADRLQADGSIVSLYLGTTAGVLIVVAIRTFWRRAPFGEHPEELRPVKLTYIVVCAAMPVILWLALKTFGFHIRGGWVLAGLIMGAAVYSAHPMLRSGMDWWSDKKRRESA